MGRKVLFAVATLFLGQAQAVSGRENLLRVTTSNDVHAGELANVYLNWLEKPPNSLTAVYASCSHPNDTNPDDIIGQYTVRGQPPQRLAWAVPSNAQPDNCIFIYNQGAKYHNEGSSKFP